MIEDESEFNFTRTGGTSAARAAPSKHNEMSDRITCIFDYFELTKRQQ